ncbi:hypothetical protein MHK_002223 [Candidatus Magnetomorum sp. HK-1]|nr:hypothetical protein MHK_002223 [Candidatus Magnetomorum sp. HK-1]
MIYVINNYRFVIVVFFIFSNICYAESVNFTDFIRYNELVDFSNKHIYGSTSGPNLESFIKIYINKVDKNIVFSNLESVNTLKRSIYIVPVKSIKLANANAFVKKFSSSYVIFFFPLNNAQALNVKLHEKSTSKISEQMELMGFHLYLLLHELGHVYLDHEEGSFEQHGCTNTDSILLKEIAQREKEADLWAFKTMNKTIESYDGKNYGIDNDYEKDRLRKRVAFIPMQVFFSKALLKLDDMLSDLQEADKLINGYMKEFRQKAEKEKVTYGEIEKLIKMHEILLNSDYIKAYRECSTHGFYFNRVLTFEISMIEMFMENDRLMMTENNKSAFSILKIDGQNAASKLSAMKKLYNNLNSLPSLIIGKHLKTYNLLTKIYTESNSN